MIGILHPIEIAAITATDGPDSVAMALTPSPREVWTGTSWAVEFSIDLGVESSHDAVYLGSTNLPADATITCGATAVLGGEFIGGTTIAVAARLPQSAGPRYHQLMVRAAPVTGRYLKLRIAMTALTTIEVGLIMIGNLITHPYAYGSGRQLVDTSKRTDLIDGGFGFEAGVTKAGFRWRFVDLDDAKREAVWECGYDRGVRRPIVVAEDIEALTDRSVHYGVFDRFEAWERANAVDTTWALSMTEWR